MWKQEGLSRNSEELVEENSKEGKTVQWKKGWLLNGHGSWIIMDTLKFYEACFSSLETGFEDEMKQCV